MKQKFSKHWVSSRQPRKQRKYRANAPLHIRRKLMSANLSKTLKQRHEKKNFPLRKGDKVKIMKGEFKKKTGKIESVDLKRLRTTIEGLNRTKKDGTKIKVYFSPSNLQIQELNLEDKKRRIAIERKTGNKSTEQIKQKPVSDKISDEQKSGLKDKKLGDIKINKNKEKKQNAS